VGVNVSTIERRCAAIGYAHKLAGHREAPTTAETVKAVLRGIPSHDQHRIHAEGPYYG